MKKSWARIVKLYGVFAAERLRLCGRVDADFNVLPRDFSLLEVSDVSD